MFSPISVCCSVIFLMALCFPRTNAYRAHLPALPAPSRSGSKEDEVFFSIGLITALQSECKYPQDEQYVADTILLEQLFWPGSVFYSLGVDTRIDRLLYNRVLWTAICLLFIRYADATWCVLIGFRRRSRPWMSCMKADQRSRCTLRLQMAQVLHGPLQTE